MANEIEEIKQRLDLVDIIQEYIPLKKAGTNYKANCPFHQEKSPSFMVSQTKQIWHCFGCHEGGDLFTFVQKMEGMDFYESLKLLANRAGVQLKQQSSQEKGKKQRLSEALEAAAQFFHKLLMEHPAGAAAKAYAKQRGLSDETIKQFQLGYAPESWDTLLKVLLKRGFSQQELIDAGLVIYNQERKSTYDRFRNRFMIPLRDPHGSIVGFTARALEEQFEGGKYINTPQTSLYDKSRVIFGLSEAKKAIKDAGYAVLVEGNMDVISSHQAGVKQVVAVSGTALTPAQLGLLKRYTQKVIFSFDADQAGFQASLRGIQAALELGFEVEILRLLAGKDPDECIKQDPELWKKSIENAQHVVDHLIAVGDTSSVRGKKELAERAVAIIRYIQNPIVRDHYAQKVAQAVQVSASAMRELLDLQPAAGQPAPQVSAEKEVEDPQTKAKKELFSLMLQDSQLLSKLSELDEIMGDGSLADLYKELKISYDKSVQMQETPAFEQLLVSLAPDLQTAATRLHMYGEARFPDLTPQQRREAYEARKTFLLRLQIKSKLEAVQKALQAAEQAADQQHIRTLSEEFSALSQRLIGLDT